MDNEILKEFGTNKPRVIVFDDDPRAGRALAGELESEGFEVFTCESADEFAATWKPGFFDLIVADWDLSEDLAGDKVLEELRERDWDVPFILVSGRLNEDDERSKVFETMLSQGSCDFVERGDDSNRTICQKAFRLLEKRDLALLRMVLRFREAAIKDVRIQSSDGEITGSELLAELVKDPTSSHQGESPLANRIANR